MFVFQIGGWPLPPLCYVALWEPLSVCEQRPDEGPQGLPVGRSHQAALLQVAERPPDGCGWMCLRCQEGAIPGEKRNLKGGGQSMNVWINDVRFSERSQLWHHCPEFRGLLAYSLRRHAGQEHVWSPTAMALSHQKTQKTDTHITQAYIIPGSL